MFKHTVLRLSPICCSNVVQRMLTHAPNIKDKGSAEQVARIQFGRLKFNHIKAGSQYTVNLLQCDQILRKIATFGHILTAFGYFRNLHLALGISLNLLWHIFYAIGKNFH